MFSVIPTLANRVNLSAMHRPRKALDLDRPAGGSGVSVSVFDVGIGIRYFAIIYNFWCNTATAMSVGKFHVHEGL